MMPHVNLQKLTPAQAIAGEDAEETRLLREMLQSATGYVQSFRWCPSISEVYLGCGVGGVVAVFLFHFDQPIGETDEWLWVIEGDLPSAYLVLDQAEDPASALEVYCQLMDEWAQAILAGRTVKDVFPVRAAPSRENAMALLKRLEFIRSRLLPNWRADWPAGDGDRQSPTQMT